MSLLTTVISGAFGGLVASLGSKFLWRYHSRPELTFESGIVKEGATHIEEPMAWGTFRVEVKNSGNSVASNCKPRIRLIGVRETTVARQPMEPGSGNAPREVPVEKKYIIDIVPGWDESTSPTRIDLNRDETAQFDLFNAHFEHLYQNDAQTAIRFGDRKDIEDIEDDGDIWETQPIRIETYETAESKQPYVNTKAKINAEDFREIEWIEKKIQITSADTEPLEGELDFRWDDPIPDVSIRSVS